MFNEDEFEGEEDQIINEEYKIWKYNRSRSYTSIIRGGYFRYIYKKLRGIKKININIIPP